ncbi:MAG: DUF126 domain-containing protein [archaeon GBS-70-058]|nr:DUF126 domain-containing protein [Candidatus Culexarchaeum nevadense]
MIIKGRIIKEGEAEGEALVSTKPIAFLGGINPKTGIVIERGHPLEGESVSGKILVFPHGKGSTVGTYIIYRMKKLNTAPAAIINEYCEPIVAVGAIIANIPCVDMVDISKIKSGDFVRVKGDTIYVNE